MGPTVASGVQLCELTLETSTLLAINCKSVCCDWLPAYRPIEEGPNAVMLGVLPSSCHVIEYAEPAGMLVEAVGLVMKTFAWARGARAARERTRREENIVEVFGGKEKEWKGKESGHADSDEWN